MRKRAAYTELAEQAESLNCWEAAARIWQRVEEQSNGYKAREAITRRQMHCLDYARQP